MTAEEIKVLEKEVSKARYALSQSASELHDLIEDRLLASFEDIPSYAEATYRACKHWYELNNQLTEAKKLLCTRILRLTSQCNKLKIYTCNIIK